GPDFDRVLRTKVTEGRWFERGDESLAWQPVIINRALAAQMYGNEDPIGKPFGSATRSSPGREQRVVGVVPDYREGGELAGAGRFAFFFKEPSAQKEEPSSELVVRLAPGTPAAFEDTLVKRLRAVAPDWSFAAEPLAEMRETSFRLRLAVVAA